MLRKDSFNGCGRPPRETAEGRGPRWEVTDATATANEDRDSRRSADSCRSLQKHIGAEKFEL